MFQPHGDDIFNISKDDDLCHFAMQLFRVAGHTFNANALISNKIIRDFIYFDIQHNQVLTTMDWNYLNQVISASLLFSNGKNYFDLTNCDTEIDYYAISLNTSNTDRSPLAYEIHKIVSRLSITSLSVILFEANKLYMFSFAERKQGQQSTIILSDWFSINSVNETTEVLFRVDAAYFTSNSVKDFFYDFEYAIARPYYIYLISSECFKYEMFPLDLFGGNNGTVVDRETINEILLDNYLSLLQAYKDDYIAEDDNNREAQSFNTEDVTLELFEFEMDTIEPDEEDTLLNDDAMEDDEFSCEEDDYLDELEEDLFEDPIKMLKWIEKHIR